MPAPVQKQPTFSTRSRLAAGSRACQAPASRHRETLESHQTKVFLIKAVVFTTETVVCVIETVVSVTETVVSATETVVSVTETVVSVMGKVA
ncbi:MAG TPA: hypothetical protein PK490_18605 [Prosthecobacter sp.]|nr:hypothetical protein [Prosthecobacter sp.]